MCDAVVLDCYAVFLLEGTCGKWLSSRRSRNLTIIARARDDFAKCLSPILNLTFVRLNLSYVRKLITDMALRFREMYSHQYLRIASPTFTSARSARMNSG